MPNTVRVRGLREMNKAMKRAPDTLKREYRGSMRRLGEPVRQAAESKALAEIGNMPRSPEWGRMRTGITTRVVYVAPKQRGVKGRGAGGRRRPTLAGLLMDRAMQPALDANEANTVREFERMLATTGRDWER